MEIVLDKCLTPTTDMIMNLMEVENAFINTNHPDFVGSADSLLNLFQPPEESEDSGEQEGQENAPKTFSLLQKKKDTIQEEKKAE